MFFYEHRGKVDYIFSNTGWINEQVVKNNLDINFPLTFYAKTNQL